MSSQHRSWTHSQTSRRDPASPRNFRPWRFHGAFGGPGVAMSNSSRPQSQTSSLSSRTHIPSLASHAFFRPMSSQRLQAQRRGNRVPVGGQSMASIDGSSELGSTTNRNSIGSNVTAQPGPDVSQRRDGPPQSSWTEFTDSGNQQTDDASPTGRTTVQSVDGSEQPLEKRTPLPGVILLDPEKQQKQPDSGVLPTRRSPISFGPSFLQPSRGTDQARNERFNHERLSSSNSSPHSVNAKMSPTLSRKPAFNYEYFSGNTVFCWGGRLQNTRDRPILPRNLHPQPAPTSDDPLALGPPTVDWIRLKSIDPETLWAEAPTKYCKTCNIWRPLRCHHCRICDNCIETQDHHCVWLNNCVGRRNYRYFLTFVSTATLLAMFLAFASLGHCLRYQSNQGVSFPQSIDKQRLPFAMFLYGLLAAPYPACLWIYHLYLMGRGETTREFLVSHQFLKKDRLRPFSQGNFLKNWLMVFLRPRPPTYYHFKKEYEEGDRRFGKRRGKMTAPLAPEQPGGGGMELHNVVGTKTSLQGQTSLRES
ncbi:MAG: hypothetical protein Q9201_000982 [Fulgogasparrea decipioides]